VRGPDGVPTAGVEVALWRWWINRIDSLSSRTDEDGMAHFYPTYSHWNRPSAISLRGGEVEVELRHAQIVDVRATDPGSALRVVVALSDESGVETPLVEWPDDDGVARFEPSAPGLWRVRVQQVPGTLDRDAFVGEIVVRDVAETQSFDVRRPAGR
jgi:hypothetical protein